MTVLTSHKKTVLKRGIGQDRLYGRDPTQLAITAIALIEALPFESSLQTTQRPIPDSDMEVLSRYDFKNR
jgi:hypothetical protein